MPASAENDGHDRGIGVSRSRREVRLAFDEDKSEQSGSSHPDGDAPHHGIDEKSKRTQESHTFGKYAGGFWSNILPDLQWVSQNNTWSKWKPVIRCALAAWISGLLFVIPKVENMMGQVISISSA